MRGVPHDKPVRTDAARPPAGEDRGPPRRQGRRFSLFRGLAKADFAWDEARLDAWLTNPQAVIPGVTMVYRQAKPETRAAIITYLKELN